MKFKELVETRFSCRNFSDKKIDKETLDIILNAARLAPSAHNNQGTRIVVVQDGIEKMKEFSKCIFGANIALIICAKKNNIVSSKYGEIDATIAATSMMYQAEDLGLGSCMIGIFSEPSIREYYHIPEEDKIVMLLIMGHKNETSKPIPMHFQRKDLKDIVFKEDYNNEYK